MLVQTQGIVFKSVKYGESSLILTVYTSQKGLKKYIISGVGSKKPKWNPGLLRPMSLIDMVAFDRSDKAINRIKELSAAYVYNAVPFEVVKGTVGLFFTEVAFKSIKEEEENHSLFNFLWDSFIFLDQTKHLVSNLPIVYLIQLTKYLGFFPHGRWSNTFPFFDLAEGVFCSNRPSQTYYMESEPGKTFDTFLGIDFADCHSFKTSKSERQIILNHLLDYFRLHISGFGGIKSYDILTEVFG